ncbi:D-alanine aminotransferase [Echinicola pacifica]|uniref:branched-chain-amino-acid transaminase n=1 Tax=Echinicola pacifica TaxID=346377 RepID=A0A918UXB7_9BACT|nr:aminotransferase class IV [Echinicola pacifica]GGZ39803.1 D-alanine aminotransferase [Echinicola pacifica]
MLSEKICKPYCFAKDEIIPSEEASLHPLDIGLIRGYAIFDFFRTVNHRPLFLKDYLDRFIQSARKAHLDLKHDHTSLQKIITDLIDKNDLEQGGVRMVLSGGISTNHFSPSDSSLYIFCEELLLPSEEKFEKGVHLLTADYIRPVAEIKTTNYALPVYLSDQWKEHQVEDVLYHFNGIISESSRSNIFMVKEGKVITPKSNILLGITRKRILEFAPDIVQRDIALEEIREADELFMTSTTKRILPITKVDHKAIGNGTVGEITKNLMTKFLEMEANEVGQ